MDCAVVLLDGTGRDRAGQGRAGRCLGCIVGTWVLADGWVGVFFDSVR